MEQYERFKKSHATGSKSCSSCPVRHNALFHDITNDSLGNAQLSRSRQIVRPAGAALFDENEKIGSMYTLYSGWVIFYKILASGKRQILNFALPGDLIGTDISEQGCSPYSAKTLTNSVLCVFPKSNMSRLLEAEHSVTQRYINMKTRDMAIYQSHLESVGRKSAEERIAFLLLELFYRSRRQDPDSNNNSDNRVEMPLTQEDIGDTMGLTKVHVNRVLTKLMNKGLLECNRGTLLLLDREALIELAQFNRNMLNIPHVFDFHSA